MNQAYEIGGVGLASQQRALDVIASNIANLSTPAFKRLDVRFSELLAQRSDPANPAASLATDVSVAAVAAQAIATLNEAGEIQQTGKPMDLAIDGQGFIELMGPSGQTLLWRGGALSIQESGLLGAAGGMPLKAMITVPSDATDLVINADGAVSALVSSGDRLDLGFIPLVRISDADPVEQLDAGLYKVSDTARLRESTAGEDGAGRLMQGALEQSNVKLNDEMVRLMIVQRSYAANAQIVQAADQLAGIANNLRK